MDERDGQSAVEGGFREYEARRPSSLFRTAGAVLFSPRRFFDRLPPDGPSGPPARYLVSCLLLATLAGAASALAFLAAPLLLALWAAGPPGVPGNAAPLAVWTAALLVAAPLALAALSFMWAALLHLLVVLPLAPPVRRRPFRATLRVACYATGSAALLAWLPVLGLLLAVAYGAYLHAAGLGHAHRVRTGRLLPGVAGLSACLLALALLGVGAGGAAGYARAAERGLVPWDLEVSAGLPGGAVELDALRVGHPRGERVREQRDASYDDAAPEARLGVQVLVVSSAPADGGEGGGDERRGVFGSATGAGGGSVEVSREEPFALRRDRGVAYGTSRTAFRAPLGAGGEPVDQETLCQIFSFAGPGAGADANGGGVVELEQLGEEGWRTLLVRAYSEDADEEEAVATFLMPYQARVGRGDRLRLEVEAGRPLSEVLLEVDRGGDGRYEERWRPEASVVGEGAGERAAPTTRADLLSAPMGPGAEPLLRLRATDAPPDAPERGSAAAGGGVTYYYLNGHGPAIYSGPFPVRRDDFVHYFSVDRAGNQETAKTADVREMMSAR